MRVILILWICLALPFAPALAQDDFGKKLELSEKMVELRPARIQLENALDVYIQNYMRRSSEEEQADFRAAILGVLNAETLEKITIDAYAETFTLQELEAMVEYYSKPEARSASDKQGELKDKIMPEIVRILDDALMRLRSAPIRR